MLLKSKLSKYNSRENELPRRHNELEMYLIISSLLGTARDDFHLRFSRLFAEIRKKGGSQHRSLQVFFFKSLLLLFKKTDNKRGDVGHWGEERERRICEQTVDSRLILPHPRHRVEHADEEIGRCRRAKLSLTPTERGWLSQRLTTRTVNKQKKRKRAKKWRKKKSIFDRAHLAVHFWPLSYRRSFRLIRRQWWAGAGPRYATSKCRANRFCTPINNSPRNVFGN